MSTQDNYPACSSCANKKSKMYKCSGCSSVSYCSKECQKYDWKIHKFTCKKYQQIKMIENAKNGPFESRIPSCFTEGEQLSFNDSHYSSSILKLAEKINLANPESHIEITQLIKQYNELYCSSPDSPYLNRIAAGPLNLQDLIDGEYIQTRTRYLKSEHLSFFITSKYEENLSLKILHMYKNNNDLFRKMSNLTSHIPSQNKDDFINRNGIEGLTAIVLLSIHSNKEKPYGLKPQVALRVLYEEFSNYPPAQPELFNNLGILYSTLVICKDFECLKYILLIYNALMFSNNPTVLEGFEENWTLLTACDFLQDILIDSDILRSLAINAGAGYMVLASKRDSFTLNFVEVDYFFNLVYQVLSMKFVPLETVISTCIAVCACLDNSALREQILYHRIIDIVNFLSVLDLPTTLTEILFSSNFPIELSEPKPAIDQLVKTVLNNYLDKNGNIIRKFQSLSSPLSQCHFFPSCNLLQDIHEERRPHVALPISFQVLLKYRHFCSDPLLEFGGDIPTEEEIMCLNFMKDMIEKGRPLTMKAICHLNYILLHKEDNLNLVYNTDPDPKATDYSIIKMFGLKRLFRAKSRINLQSSEKNNYIQLLKFYFLENFPSCENAPFVHHSLILPALSFFVQSYYIKEGKISPLKLAAWLHHCLLRIRPFVRGNGKIAAMISNWVLIRNNYGPIIFTDKKKYRTCHSLNSLMHYYINLHKSSGHVAEFESEQVNEKKSTKKLSPTLLETATHLKNDGNLAFKRGETSKALDIYMSAIILDHNDLRLHTNCALCFVKLGLFSNALLMLYRAAKISPNDVKTRYLQGRALEGLNRLDEARIAYKFALKNAKQMGISALDDISSRVRACEDISPHYNKENVLQLPDEEEKTSILQEVDQNKDNICIFPTSNDQDSLVRIFPQTDETIDTYLKRCLPSQYEIAALIQVPSLSFLFNLALSHKEAEKDSDFVNFVEEQNEFLLEESEYLPDDKSVENTISDHFRDSNIFNKEIESASISPDIKKLISDFYEQINIENSKLFKFKLFEEKRIQLLKMAEKAGIDLEFSNKPVFSIASPELINICKDTLASEFLSAREKETGILLQSSSRGCIGGRWVIRRTRIGSAESDDIDTFFIELVRKMWSGYFGIGTTGVTVTSKGIHPTCYMINVHTSNFLDKSEIMQARNTLRSMGITEDIGYLPDIFSYLNYAELHPLPESTFIT